MIGHEGKVPYIICNLNALKIVQLLRANTFRENVFGLIRLGWMIALPRGNIYLQSLFPGLET